MARHAGLENIDEKSGPLPIVELVASAGFGAFDARERYFLGNRAPFRRKFPLRSKEECACQAF
jgi:hypothetical protein